MLDPDISTEDAKRLLSLDDRTPATLDRRRFLQMVGYGVGGGALLGTIGESIVPSLLPGRIRDAWAGSPVGPNDGILVLLGFDGGNDFLNTFVPYTNNTYYGLRTGGFAIPPASVLPLNSTLGLNNRLPFVKTLWDRGEVAIVQGVGYPNPDLSHFNSMAIWMNGKNTFSPLNGWVGRWVDGLGSAANFASATVGSYLPLHLVGDVSRGTAIPPWGLGFGTDTRETDQIMYDGIRAYSAQPAGRGALHDALATGMRGVVDVGRDVSPVFSRPRPEGDLARKMTIAARLINADLGLRVIDAAFGGFDTHSSQPADHAELMDDLNAGLYAFFSSLDDRFRSRVTVMTYSEFGRTRNSNDSDGTDHGTASTHMVIGAAVQGGIYGLHPNLNIPDPWDPLEHNVDFRSMYATMLDGWLGGGSTSVLGATYPTLNLFRRGPGLGVAGGSTPTNALGDYVPVTPARLYDSRDGTGGRRIQLGAGAAGEVQVTGLGGVPASGVTAVAVNVTSTAATAVSTFAVWPEGEPRPNVANIGVVTSRAVPNLSIVKVGKGGRIHVGNDLGGADAVVDVVGYFTPTTSNRLQPITPHRALDTRDGTGGRSTPLPAAGTYDVTVTGIGGVPANAQAVVVNLTATGPTGKGFATLWPAGVARPVASTLNYDVGVVVANLAIIKVGTGGKISLYNHAGSTNYVIDILGYMVAGSGSSPGRFMPMAPSIVYDTRTSSGGPGPITGPTTKVITVTGVQGVPANAIAVALNVSVRKPTANGFVTVWPNGEARPTASNLNPRATIDVSNLAIVKVGTQSKVQLYLHTGKADVVLDIVGYFTA